jgi:ribosome-associated translation inhibitor RaiA
MEVIIRSKTSEINQSLHDHINRRVDFALGRFSQLIDFVRVDLIDLNGPKGGLDRHCEVKIKFIRHGLIVGKATDTTFVASISHALERAANQVKKGLKHRLAMRTRSGSHRSEEIANV